jgi:hypothetical protein
MVIYSKYHHWSYKNMIPPLSYETYESLTPEEHYSLNSTTFFSSPPPVLFLRTT